MKKILSIILCVMTFSILTGCDLVSSKEPKLVYKELSEKERTLLRITGNNVALYEIENMPTDLEYELTISYELYEKGKKVKEDVITGVTTGNMEKDQKISIAINLKEDKIDSIISTGGLESGSNSAEIDLSGHGYAFVSDDVKLESGKEIYIYQGSKANKDHTVRYISLGTPIDEKVVEDILKDQESDVFIKLSLNYKE